MIRKADYLCVCSRGVRGCHISPEYFRADMDDLIGKIDGLRHRTSREYAKRLAKYRHY